MSSQGGSKVKILQQISKAISRHPLPFQKFKKRAKEIIRDIGAE